MKRVLIIIVVLGSLLSCNREDKTLISDIDINSSVKVKNINDLFGSKPKYIELEMTSKSLVGKIQKIIKKNNYFFICSHAKVMQFDSKGKFISVLSKRGNGPGEYESITDFDVLEDGNNNFEIWICDYKTIRKYTLVNEKWEKKENIEFPYVVNEFHIFDKNKILLLAGLNENSITLVNGKGQEIGSFLKREIPFLIMKPMQFIPFGSNIIFQKGISNSCVVFSPEDNSFQEKKIVEDSKFISEEKLLELFRKYNYAYLGKLRKYDYIRTIRKISNRILIEFKSNGKRFVLVRNGKQKAKVVQYSENKLSYLFSLNTSSSTNSFILVKDNPDFDKNPIIVEY